ncbi:MAG: glycosyltransferase family 4 protein [Campylobacterales bacterium]|nr:glycosyltransferase family 4 protein [Campylobacterales bacterium]
MNKRIWIINEYAGSPKYGMTFRHYYLAKAFNDAGCDTTIISGAYSHFLKQLPQMAESTYKVENVEGVRFLWIKVVKYMKSFDKKRVYKWFEFMMKLFFISKYIPGKPDVIICSPTAPFSILPAYWLAKKYHAKLIFEVRDIWPLTLIELGGFSKTNPFVVLMGWFERFALKKSDIIVSNLQNYGQHMKDLGIDRPFHWISNGIDLKEMEEVQPLDENVRAQIPKEKFIVGYTGKIGVSNALEVFLEAAVHLKGKTDIVFIIVGEGQEKASLIKRYGALENVVFIDSITKQQVQSILALFDACYIGLQSESLFRFGVSPNKVFDYMYSAKPIIYAIDSGEHNLIEIAGCGISVEAENPEAVAKAIAEIYEMPQQEREKLGLAGRKYVLEHFTYMQLAKKYLELL